MSTSNTVTKTDLQNIINAIFPATTEDMSQAQIDAFVASLSCVGINAVDYVVEEGSGYNGRYRKWNSGRAEWWYHTYSASGLTTAVWTSPVYYADSTSWANIWNGLFNDVPTDVLCTSNNSQVIGVVPYSFSSSGISNLRFLTIGAKTNVAYAFSVYAIGTWK